MHAAMGAGMGAGFPVAVHPGGPAHVGAAAPGPSSRAGGQRFHAHAHTVAGGSRGYKRSATRSPEGKPPAKRAETEEDEAEWTDLDESENPFDDRNPFEDRE